jgi:hypothetical protein
MGLPIDTETDELTKYDRDPTPIDDLKAFNPMKWWDDAQSAFPTLHL